MVENITLIFREYLCIAVLDEDDFDGVKIPSELATRIEEWQRELERTDTFEHNNNFDWDNFGKRGIRLAIDLKKYIGQIIPSPLDTVIEKIWGFASNQGRHIKEGREPDYNETELLVGLAASISSYFASKRGKIK